jgi:UDP-N-acetylmuramoyl-tripeptide--D-alanyl-D-alanine ligase
MKELGEQSDELHLKIGELAAESGVDSLICVGESASFIRDGFLAARSGAADARNAENAADARYFPTKPELFAHPELIARGDNVLVKASHSMDFGEIAAWLRSLR